MMAGSADPGGDLPEGGADGRTDHTSGSAGGGTGRAGGDPGGLVAGATGGGRTGGTGGSGDDRGHPPAPRPVKVDDEDGLCDVLSERAFVAETTEALLASVPDLTATQLVEIRRHMVAVAQRHGWVEG